MNQLSIFPTPLEQLRVIAQYFDLSIQKDTKKALDDKVHDKNIRLELMWEYIQTTWYEPLKRLLPEELAEMMNRHFCEYISNYLELIGDCEVSGVSREQLLDVFTKFYFPVQAYLFLMDKIPEQYQFPDVTALFIYEKKSVGLILDWLQDNPTWQDYLSQLNTKEDKDKIERWRKGEYLPSYQAIQLLSKEKLSDWGMIQFWLLIARALDAIRHDEVKDVFNCLNFILGIEMELGSRAVPLALDMNLNNAIRAIQQAPHHYPQERMKIFANLQYNLLARDKEKNNKMKDKAFTELNVARSIADSHQILQYESHMWDKLEARWHLYDGNLEKAVEMYEKSFEQGLFCAGSNLKSIIQEALVTTAYFEKSTGKSQRKLLAHLKNAMVMFSYEMPTFEQPATKINHKETVADWEVNMWANEFHRFFPKNSYFPNVDYPYLESSTHGIFFFEEIEKIKPDYKNPNKMISWQGKRMPQLVLYLLFHEHFHDKSNYYLEYIRKLLESGADVNQLSSANESALLLAIEKMDLEAMPVATQDKRLFDLIIQYPHKKEVVNTKTSKLEKYPLMQAVLTGRPDVVKKILEMGADVDQVNHTNTTPLYQCLTILSILHKGKSQTREMFKQFEKINMNCPIQQEAHRRHHAAYHGAGIGAFYHEKPIQFKNEQGQSFFNELKNAMVEILFDNYTKYTSIDKLQEIVQILLDYGADPNYPHNLNGFIGYTPLMMAIEINNPVIFEMMKQKGGDTSLAFTWRNMPKNCHDVKSRWGSDKIHL